MPHRAWNKDLLLRIAADNWPDDGPLLSSKRGIGLSVDLSEADRAALRRGNVSSFFPYRGRVYAARDFLTVAGTPMKAASWASEQIEHLKRAEQILSSHPSTIIAELQRRQPATRLPQPNWSIVVRDRTFAVHDSSSGRYLPLTHVPRT